jgi:hypothetical protein
MGPGVTRRAHLANSGTLLAAAWIAGALSLAPAAAAEQLVVQGDSAKVALEPYSAPSTLGGRAQLSANLGAVDTSLSAAVERGGSGVGVGGDAWTQIYSPSAWISDDVRLGANWASGATRLTLEAGDRQRWTRNLATPLASASTSQLAVDGERFLRVHATAQADKFNLQLGAESSTTALDTETLGASPTRLWITSQRLSADLAWRPSSRFTLEGGETAQTVAAGWRGPSDLGAQDAYLTPNLALTISPWGSAKWRLEAAETLSPLDPGKFAAYAQIATPGAPYTPQPDRGWRYGVKLEHQLPGGIELTAEAADERLASVTELGPVGVGEAPVGIGAGERRQVAVNLAASLSRLGLADGTFAGTISMRSSQVQDPFTGLRREMSGEAPYSARLSLGGALAAPDLRWSLTAQADGPQSLYQMAQVTNLGATAGLGGALTYGAGPVKVSLEVDNLVGGMRDVTTLNYAGSRAEDSLSNVDRRREDGRAVRIALRRGL